MTTEEKFHAAVNVIRSLPKNGSYQPSNELMLRFYAYFKQATNGPITGSRPAFWDIVGRAKYDAWKNLGNMSKADAMAKYVEELHSIVETMSYSDKVANFLEAPSNELESVNMNDLQLVAGDIIKRVRSQSNSPIMSRETSPMRVQGLHESDSAGADIEESDEEYIDTIEAPDPKRHFETQCYEPGLNGLVPREHVSRNRTKYTSTDVSSEISKIIHNLQVDIDALRKKVGTLEKDKMALVAPRRGFFGNLSPTLVTFMVVWPFLCTFIINRYIRNK